MDLTRISERFTLLLSQEKIVRTLLLVGVLIYGALLAERMGAYAGGSDSSGYLNNAKLIAAGEIQTERRTVPDLPVASLPSFTFVPLGFVPVGDDHMVPTYPIGLSVFVALLAPLFGWEFAPQVVIWLHAMANLWLMYRIARLAGASRRLSAFGALLLGLSPLYLYLGVQFMSDIPSVTWCLAAVLCAWRSRLNPRWAYLAGVAVTIAVLLRPTNLLVMLAVAVALGSHWRLWLRLSAAGLPGAIVQGYYSYRLYGSPFRTGYGAVGQIFSWDYVPPALQNYVQWLPVMLTPALVLAFLPSAASRTGRKFPAALLLAWALPTLVFYAFYFHTHESWWYLRFILPAFPPVILLMLFAGRQLAAKWSWLSTTATWVALFIGLIAWDGYWGLRLSVNTVGKNERNYLEATRWVESRLPANSVLALMQTSGAFYYYSHFTFFRYDQIAVPDFRAIATAAAAAGRPIYAVLFPFETKIALEKKLPGRWTQVGAARQITFWRLDGMDPQPIAAPDSREFFSAVDGPTTITARTSSGWFDVEDSFWHQWCWSRGHGQLLIDVWPERSVALHLSFALRSLTPRQVKIAAADKILWEGTVGPERLPIEIDFQSTDGHASLDFSSDTPAVRESDRADARELAFEVYDPHISLRSNP
jgi:hypothetical protein